MAGITPACVNVAISPCDKSNGCGDFCSDDIFRFVFVRPAVLLAGPLVLMDETKQAIAAHKLNDVYIIGGFHKNVEDVFSVLGSRF